MFVVDSNKTPEDLALTAIGLQMTIEITRLFDFAIRWSINLETYMVSVQRIVALTKLQQERSSETLAFNSVFRGHIKFNNVEMSYKPDL